MNFKTTKIGEKEKKEKRKKIAKKTIKISIGIFSSIAIIIVLVFGIFKAVKNINIGTILEVAGDELETDVYGHTNFLLLGHGGANHDGGSLTDSMIVASLDKENKLVSMISIPRDIYVEDPLLGNFKINEVYFRAKNYYEDEEKGIEHLKGKIEKITGVPIHYWAMIDFHGFTEIIDEIGGIEVNVTHSITDLQYPKDGTYLYEPFYLDAGVQTLDGSTALKYARSRHGYGSSDYDRSSRQQEIIYAVKEQVLSSNIILNPKRIKNIMNKLSENIKTNMNAEEIITLGSVVTEGFTRDNISQKLIHDDPTQCGGFLYTPEREYYNNLFVLIPAGGFDSIHMYANLNFNHPLAAKENKKIHILNGTSTIGVAGETKQILKRFCFDVTRFGNADTKDIKETTYYYKGEIRPDTLDFLEQMIPGKESTTIPEKYKEYMLESDILIELGEDYVNSDKYYEDPFNSLYYLYQ